jgi:hypothetical protein
MRRSSQNKQVKKNLQTYVTPHISDKVESLARKEGLNSSEWLKQLVMSTLNEKDEET